MSAGVWLLTRRPIRLLWPERTPTFPSNSKPKSVGLAGAIAGRARVADAGDFLMGYGRTPTTRDTSSPNRRWRSSAASAAHGASLTLIGGDRSSLPVRLGYETRAPVPSRASSANFTSSQTVTRAGYAVG